MNCSRPVRSALNSLVVRWVVGLAAMAFAPALASAQTSNWTNFGTTGTWGVGTNWDTPPTFTTTTVLSFPSTPFFNLTGPFQPTGTYTSTVDSTYTINQMVFNNFGSPDTGAASGVTTTPSATTSTISFAGTNPAITQNGTGSVTFSLLSGATPVTTNAGSDLTINGSGTGNLTFAGSIGGTGNLIISQTGVGSLPSTGSFLTLSVANTFSGGSLTLNNGNVIISNATALGPATTNVVINGGNIQATAALTLAQSFTLNSTLFLSGLGNSLTFTGVISGNGGITVKNFSGAPGHVFENTISGTGAIVINSYAGGVPALSLASIAGVSNGTALNASSYSITNSLLTINDSSVAVTRLNSAAPMTINAGLVQVAGNASVAVSESLASLTLSGMNIYFNSVSTAAMSLTFGSLTRQNNATFQVTSQGAANNFGQTPGSGVGSLFFTNSLIGDNINGVLPYGSALINPTASQASTFVRYDPTNGVTPLALATDYDLRHPYLLGSSPTLNYRVASGGTFGNTIGDVTGNLSVNSLLLETSGAATSTLGASIYGNGTISLTSGALMTSQVNGVTSPTVIGSVIQPNIALGAVTGYFHSQYSLSTTSSGGGITFVGAASPFTVTFSVFAGGSIIAGNITGTAGLVKTGSGNLQLNGDNSGLSGGLYINGGNVIYDRDVNLGAAGQPIFITGGITGNVNGGLNFLPMAQFGSSTASSITVNRPITLGPAGGAIGPQLPGTVMTLSNTITGGRLSVLGSGELLLTNSGNTHVDDVVGIGNYLAASSDGALGAASGKVYINVAGTFQPTASFSTARDFVLIGGGASIIYTGGNNLTITGQILGLQSTGGTPNLQKSGLGNLTLTNAALFNGTFTIGDTTATRRIGTPFAQTGGTITLSGPNGAMAEATAYTINQGALMVLDNSGAVGNVNQNRISSSVLTLTGGEFKLIGNANGNVVEHVGRAATNGLTITAGLGSTVTVAQPTSTGGQNTNLVITSYSNPAITAQSVAFFRGDNLGGSTGDFTNVTFVAAPTLTNSILANGLYANSSTANPQDFATVNGSNQIVAFAAYTALPTTGGATTSTNNLTGAQAQTGATSSNALKLSNAQIDLVGNSLSITGAGQLLSTGALNQDTILDSGAGGSGLIFTGTSAKITVNSSLDIGTASAPVNITTATGLFKFGPGDLRISNATGVTGGNYVVAQGTMTLLPGLAAIPLTSSTSVGIVIAPGATFNLNGYGTTAVPVTVNSLTGFGTLKIGTGAFSNGLAASTTSSTFGGSFDGSGTLIKNGTGTLTLVGNSPTFSGSVAILAGAVTVGANVVPTDPVNPGPLGTSTTAIQLGNTTGASTATLNLGQLLNTFQRDIVVPAGGTGNAIIQALNGAGTGGVNNGVIATLTSNITLNGRTLQINAGANGATVPNFGAVTLSGQINGTGTTAGFAIVLNSGNINLWGNNTFTGNVQVADSVRAVIGMGTDTAFGVSGNNLVFSSTAASFRADNGLRTISNEMDFGTTVPTTATTVPFVGTNDMNWTGAILAGNAARTFETTSTGTTTLSGIISSTGTSGGITKTGGGVLVLSGNNTYTGNTTLTTGTLGFGIDSTGTPTVTSGPIGTGTLTIGNGTTIRAVGGAHTVNNAVTVNGNFAVDGSNALTLSGAVAFGATVRTIVVTNTAPTNFSGAIGGSGGGIFKDGPGTLLLNGVNNYSGLTTVNAGTLGGSGTIAGALQVNSGATLSPGNSPGKLTVTGGMTLAAGSTFFVELNGNDQTGVAGTDFDQVALGGSALTMTNPTLTGTFGYTPTPTDTITIIAGASSVTGQFASATSATFGGYNMTIAYNASTVVLSGFTPVPEPATILGLGAATFGVVGFMRRRKV